MFYHTGPKRTSAFNPLTERATGATQGNSRSSSVRNIARFGTCTESEEQTEIPHNPAGRRAIPDLAKGFSLAQLSVTQSKHRLGVQEDSPSVFIAKGGDK